MDAQEFSVGFMPHFLGERLASGKHSACFGASIGCRDLCIFWDFGCYADAVKWIEA